MSMAGLARTYVETPVTVVWSKTSATLKHELGDATFGSWLGQAALCPQGDDLCLVAATGVARDWIRRNAWRRIAELWAQNDPLGRRLDLKSRMEFEALNQDTTRINPLREPAVLTAALDMPIAEISEPAPTPPRAARLQGLQERFGFDTFVVGPANEFAFAVARRVASWADGHFNPVLFHGPYGFGKTHLLNAMAWEAMRTAPDKRVVYLTAERFTSTFVKAPDPRLCPRCRQYRGAARPRRGRRFGEEGVLSCGYREPEGLGLEFCIKDERGDTLNEMLRGGFIAAQEADTRKLCRCRARR